MRRRSATSSPKSVGGSQTLNLAFTHLDRFAYVGAFNSGILGGGGAEECEKTHLVDLDNASLKKGLKLLWFSAGVDDTLIANSKSTVELWTSIASARRSKKARARCPD